jgi:hypothetical protein
VPTFPDLRRNVQLQRDDPTQPGRWVLTPRKGSRFVGNRERARRRARERRRRIVVVLLEAIAATFLIGMFPPLRGMLMLTAALSVLLLAYVGLIAYMIGGGRQGTQVAPIAASESTERVLPFPQAPIEFDGEPPRVRIATR